MDSKAQVAAKQVAQVIGRRATGQPGHDATKAAPQVSSYRAHPGTSSDATVAAAALQALGSNRKVPDYRVTLAVKKGWITLSGTVDWPAQKDSAIDSVAMLPGVSGVTNNIVLSSVFVARANRGT